MDNEAKKICLVAPVSLSITLTFQVLLPVHGLCLCFCNQEAYVDNLADVVNQL